LKRSRDLGDSRFDESKKSRHEVELGTVIPWFYYRHRRHPVALRFEGSDLTNLSASSDGVAVNANTRAFVQIEQISFICLKKPGYAPFRRPHLDDYVDFVLHVPSSLAP
jgi:hypothetical protein